MEDTQSNVNCNGFAAYGRIYSSNFDPSSNPLALLKLYAAEARERDIIELVSEDTCL
jgi:hypothetical protein